MKRFKIIIVTLALATVAVICGVRWRAWFAMPAEPEWTADTLDIRHKTFASYTLMYSPELLRAMYGAEPDTLRLLVFGDVHNSIERDQYRSIAARHPGLTAYAQLGDFMDRGYFYYAQLLAHQLDSTVFDSLPLICCAGNHEYSKGIRRVLYSEWKTMFPQPANGPINFIGRSYYIDFPNLRYIVIDTNGIHDLRDFTRVVTWSKAAIREAQSDSQNRKFTVVMMHHPVLSSAKGRFNPGVFTFFYRTLGEADLVLAGHDHNYARRLPFVNLSSVTTKSRPVREPFFGLLPFENSAEGAFYAILTVTAPTDSDSPETASLTLDVYTLDGTLVDAITLPNTPSHRRGG